MNIVLITGAPADRTDETNPDWVPSQNLGYISTVLPKKSALARMKRTVERAKHAESQHSAVVQRSHVAEFIKMDAAMVLEDHNYSSDRNEFELQTQYNFTQFRGTLSPVKSEEYEPYSQRHKQPQLSDTCRLCLADNVEKSVSIYTTLLYDNQTTVAQSIERLTDIQVNELLNYNLSSLLTIYSLCRLMNTMNCHQTSVPTVMKPSNLFTSSSRNPLIRFHNYKA